MDRKDLFSNDDFSLCLRIYDITNGEIRPVLTCIMKEIVVQCNELEFSFRPPVSDGSLLIEVDIENLMVNGIY